MKITRYFNIKVEMALLLSSLKELEDKFDIVQDFLLSPTSTANIEFCSIMKLVYRPTLTKLFSRSPIKNSVKEWPAD
jgi:hypothetical protein